MKTWVMKIETRIERSNILKAKTLDRRIRNNPKSVRIADKTDGASCAQPIKDRF